MSGPDPIDLLSPVSDAEAAAAFGDAGREDLLDELTRLPIGRGARQRPARRRRRLAIALAALALAVTATAATWAIRGRASAHETTSVECVIKGVDTVIPSTSGDPAHDCAVEWTRELKEPAPPLRAYDNGLGGVTVILRSQKPQAGWKRLVFGQDADLIQLQNSLDDYIHGLNSSCMDSAAARSFSVARLAQFSFTGWTVAVRNPGPPATTLPTPTVTTESGAKPAPGESTSGTQTCVGGALVDPATESVTLFSRPVQTAPKMPFEQLAVKLQPVTKRCDSLPAAVASVRAVASSLGLSESAGNARNYELNATEDNSLRCASIYETVGGTIFVTVRGPRR